jgi:hypothetical protein
MVTPKKGFSSKRIKERSLARRITEWVPLVGTALFFSRGEYTKFEYDYKEVSALKQLYHSANVVLLGIYLFAGIKTDNWTTRDYKRIIEEKNQRISKVDSNYNSIVNKNVEDTTFVNLLNKYVPLSEKEKIVKQNELEKSLK